ncbi:hypothetical protein Kisp01_69580 [Kineosporia sp. NBRC 101677]|uniref:hypothetical protein n=1 Tax=Kineosporia sp. NBRC 101677 TaxID=3032197 RepID=UPI0024A3F24B|nr:hypothetical protein [Kineosporia sp. NBRC 101677]GLY19944.1 hypothetical protein Kisp01_69580 [Kineosporia sp. NBRC 101677]
MTTQPTHLPSHRNPVSRAPSDSRKRSRANAASAGKPEDSSGQASVFVIALVALTFVLTAFFVDVSRSLNAHGASLEVAAQAARAAADQVTQESLRTGNPQALRIDPQAAHKAGQTWLSQAGASGTIEVVDGGTAVTVTARVPCPASLLKAFGYGDLSRPATASATLLTGTAGDPGQPITPALAQNVLPIRSRPVAEALRVNLLKTPAASGIYRRVPVVGNGISARAAGNVWTSGSLR